MMAETFQTNNASLEDAILLEACKLALDEEGKKKMKKLLATHRVNWLALLTSANIYSFYPVIHYFLKVNALSDYLSLSRQRKLQFLFIRNRVKNLEIMRETASVCGRLAEAGIPTVLLKGCALISTVYPDIGIRHVSDIDVLVKESQLEAAASALQNAGYCKIEGWTHGNSHHHAAPLVNPNTKIMIELHRQLGHQRDFYAFDEGDLLQRKVPFTFERSTLYMPCVEHLIFHVFVHFSKPLKKILDLCTILKYYGQARIDWHYLCRIFHVKPHKFPIDTVSANVDVLDTVAVIDELFAVHEPSMRLFETLQNRIH